MKQEKKSSVLRSVKGKLITLGCVSVATTLILGCTGINVLRSNDNNNQVLADINNINLLQNENNTLETEFLYDLQPEHYENIQKNLDTMDAAVTDALTHSSQAFKADLTTIAENISSLKENMTSLTLALTERSFDSTQGMYADFLGQDETLTGAFDQMDTESAWVDGAWMEASLQDMETVTVGDESYRRFSYETDIASIGKRDYLILRIGNNAVQYTGSVYINHICFDGTRELELSGMVAEDLSKSYGDGLSELSVTDFDGESSIVFKGTYTDANENWQEASIEIPVRAYPMEESSRISFDVYFEETQLPVMKFAVAYNEKYNFADTLISVNKQFQEYNKLVAEGTDASEYAADITKMLQEMTDNISLYTMNTAAAGQGETALAGKSESLKKILEEDTEILALKTDNNALSSSLTTAVSSVREQIEADTEASRISMLSLIVGIFGVGTVLVTLLTVFVITSVQKSIQGFRSTLTSISQGQIRVKAKTGRGDEFDVFGRALNHMTDKLTEVLGSVASIAAEVQESGSRLEEMAQATSATSSQIDVSVSEIAKGANEQAGDVEQSTNSITELGNLMDSMVQNVTKLDDTSVYMKNASDEAVSILHELSVSNEKMTEGIHNIADQITRTNDSVNKIEETVSLIASIAKQTNLLSLNASIEAARAGEAGKGFAVVATEIQQLADQSNRSANTIYDVISTLTNEFETTLQIMQEVENATAIQNEKLSDTQKQFVMVNDGIAQSRDKTAVMKESIEECNQLRLDVSQLMENLSAISAENAAATSETADSMQVLDRTITELLDASRNLLDMSKRLEDNMQFFSL